MGRRPLPYPENGSLFRVVAPTAWGLLLGQRMRFQLPVEALLTALALLVAPSPGHAAEPASTPGPAMYLRYCGACHGPAGKGDGIAGTFITPKPADLTQIAKKNGGTFPFQVVQAYIDGTKDMRAHGDPAMPVWGETFRAESGWDMGRRVEVQGKLMLITEYVRSIQAK
jgi:mono/diheme cytochrome c family protein